MLIKFPLRENLPRYLPMRNAGIVGVSLNEAAEGGVALYIEIHSQTGPRTSFAMKPRIGIVELDARHISLYWKSRNIFN